MFFFFKWFYNAGDIQLNFNVCRLNILFFLSEKTVEYEGVEWEEQTM